jgi:uncharacterized protein YigE (DUF2233 family)
LLSPPRIFLRHTWNVLMTLRLLPLLPALLLPLSALASGKCTLTDPSLTLQSYTVNPQRERIAMYWKKRMARPSDRCVRCWRISIRADACRWR